MAWWNNLENKVTVFCLRLLAASHDDGSRKMGKTHVNSSLTIQ